MEYKKPFIKQIQDNKMTIDSVRKLRRRMMFSQVFVLIALGGLVAWLVIAAKQVNFKQKEYSTAINDIVALKL